MIRRSSRNVLGFTLIEMMVTIGLVAFLMTLGVPLAREWVQSAHQREAAGLMTEALGRAKRLPCAIRRR